MTLDAAEWRWRAGAAMNAREVHDLDDVFDELTASDGEGPGWRAPGRWCAIGSGSRPTPASRSRRTAARAAVPDWSARPVHRRESLRIWAADSVELQARRRKSDGPAPVFRLRVDLRGATPPIWRLEVASDTTLAELHGILQIAFNWDNGRLHCFETDFGTFGIADRGLGHCPEHKAALEQLLVEGGKMTYTRTTSATAGTASSRWSPLLRPLMASPTRAALPGAAPPRRRTAAGSGATKRCARFSPTPMTSSTPNAWRLGCDGAFEFDPHRIRPGRNRPAAARSTMNMPNPAEQRHRHKA